MLDRARYRGAMLGGLAGDVVGAPFEGHVGVVASAAVASVLDASSVSPFTDDTALTVALAESLLRSGGIDEDDLAVAFAAAWAAAPDLGYSSRTAQLLRSIHAGARWSAGDVRHGRASNGAAMRVAPIALWAAGGRADVAEMARRSARVTHDHPDAIAGAVAQAVAVAVALCHPVGTPVDAVKFVTAVRLDVADPVLAAKLELAAQLAQHGDAAEIAARIGTGLLAADSVPAAICSFLSHPQSFPDAVTLAVSLGGDADTIASMTGAMSGALLGESSIPARWLERTTVEHRVRDLADAIYAVAMGASPSAPES